MSAQLPHGIRNGNPGNLRPNAAWKWQGEGLPDTGPAGPYCTFDTPENGIRAMIRDCRTKRRRGLDTLYKIKAVYAPAADGNDVEAYAKNVAGMISEMGYPVTAKGPLPADTMQFRIALAKAMIRVECGDPAPFGRPPYWFDDATFERAAAAEDRP